MFLTNPPTPSESVAGITKTTLKKSSRKYTPTISVSEIRIQMSCIKIDTIESLNAKLNKTTLALETQYNNVKECFQWVKT